MNSDWYRDLKIMHGHQMDERMTDEQRKLFFQYVPLVGFVVKKIVGYGVPPEPLEYDDLMQLGMLGLMDAVKRFDPSRGVQFQTYALNRIRGTIQDELRKLDWVPRSVRKQTKKMEKKLQELEQHKVIGSDEEMARQLGLTPEEYNQLLQFTTTTMIESKLSVDNEETHISVIDTDEEHDPDRKLQNDELRNAVYQAIEKLTQRDKLVLVLYYYEELTFKEIARILKLTEARVSQIHEEIMTTLRRQLKEHTR
ncbi:MAG: FliA/WhiG family RNA polymerase sigma factor [Bacteroidetes bacterium]|nr:FliA/WhiG family RNA polymerase sigma factor [Bacteroidota bacterium]